MCGICGILYFDKDQNVNELTLRRMCNVIFHRGPDAEGVFLNGNIGLGIRRLKIIDLEGGNQPIFNEDRSVVVVLNGEIYNFWELREELEGKGHKFYTASDTEVIVHAYEEYGEQCVQKLDGMFAFAIWDENNRRLFFARDRIGIKPLYYTVTDEKLLFGSEVKAILLEGTVMRSVDLESLHHYLSLNYVPGEKTMFRGIVKLLPGHYLVVEAGALSVHRYWDVEYSRSDDPIYDESYYCERLLELLKESVKRHMISDVPIGVLLSGGIDSSTVLALAAQLVDRPIKTFSIGFHEKTYSELPYASVVAKHFRTEHQEFIVEPQIEELLPTLVWHMDEPCADSSALPVYYLSKMARQQVTVALSGDGGDELFAGYETYSAYKVATLYRRVPRFLRNGIVRPVVERLPTSSGKVSFEYKAKRFVEGSDFDVLRAHYWWNGTFNEQEKRALYSADLLRLIGTLDTCDIFREYFRRQNNSEIISKLQYVDTKLLLPDDFLNKVDRMSMANSLEVRPPFLDHRVVEFAAQIPALLKSKGLLKKYILKKVAGHFLPDEIVHRKKQGFSIPVHKWLREDLRELVLDLLSPARMREMGFFNEAAIRCLLNDHLSLRRNLGFHLWGLMVFLLWHRFFIEPPVVTAP